MAAEPGRGSAVTSSGYFPLLAVLTGIFEFGAAAWTLTRKGRKRILHPIAAIFLFLAGYQFAEVAVCSHPDNLLWARWAFFDITWLPPLALWLTAVLGFPEKRGPKIFASVYFAAAAALCVWIFADPGCITRTVCQVVTARYHHPLLFDTVYGVFYQLGLMVIVFAAAAGMARTSDRILRGHLALLQAGVLGFVFPALAVRVLAREPEGSTPSVMCHFALVLAFALFAIVIRERRFGRSGAQEPLAKV